LPTTETSCYAWAMLSNHAHFLLRTGTTGLSIVMKRLLTGYVVSFNRRGIYAKDKNYDRLELANRIYTPSYISLETVLSREGIVFLLASGILLLLHILNILPKR